jgi:hypothetical protein
MFLCDADRELAIEPNVDGLLENSGATPSQEHLHGG